MKALQFIIYIALLAAFVSCTKESELRESVSNPDPENPGLPAYSEMGYNSFGAYYDRSPFVSNSRTPFKIIVENGLINFQFKGSLTDEVGTYYSYLQEELELHLIMPNFIEDSNKELVLLNDSVLDLKAEGVELKLFRKGLEKDIEVLNGNFHFKNVQELLIDKKFEEMIISGTFEFQAIIDEEPSTIDYGRFDMGVDYHNFYILD